MPAISPLCLILDQTAIKTQRRMGIYGFCLWKGVAYLKLKMLHRSLVYSPFSDLNDLISEEAKAEMKLSQLD